MTPHFAMMHVYITLGVSLGDDCLTVSMGFRSPTHRSMLTALCDFICQNTVPEKLMYSDPDLKLQSSSGYIGNIARETISSDLKGHILRSLDDTSVFEYWLGRYLTIPLRMQLNKPKPFFLDCSTRRSLKSLLLERGLGGRIDSPSASVADQTRNIGGDENVSSILSGQSYEDDDEYMDDSEDEVPYSLRGDHRVATDRVFDSVDDVLAALSSGDVYLRRAEGAKLAFINTAIFVDGEAYEFPAGSTFLGPLLCDRRVLTLDTIQQSGLDLGLLDSGNRPRAFLSAFIEAGYLYPCDIDIDAK